MFPHNKVTLAVVSTQLFLGELKTDEGLGNVGDRPTQEMLNTSTWALHEFAGGWYLDEKIHETHTSPPLPSLNLVWATWAIVYERMYKQWPCDNHQGHIQSAVLESIWYIKIDRERERIKTQILKWILALQACELWDNYFVSLENSSYVTGNFANLPWQ